MTAGPIDPRPRRPRPSRRSRPPPARAPTRGAGASRRWLGSASVVLLLWEAVKWLGGDPWRFKDVLGTGLAIDHSPPFRFPFATDLKLPHWLSILGALAAPVQRNAQQSLGQFLVGAAFYTWREAAIGFAVGALLGLVLATLFVHSRLLGACVRAVRHRQPDDPDRGARADHRGRLRPQRHIGRGHRHVPDLLPGHHRRDPRPPLARSTGARADALVRRRDAGRPTGRCAFPRRCRTCSRR